MLRAGDLAKVNLGLKPEVYARLAAEVDTIVHNGALVNHAFSYRQLFEPNVLGTVEIMKLAIATRIKALTFISSVGVAGGLDHPGAVSEEEVGTNLCTEHAGDNGYALGCDPTHTIRLVTSETMWRATLPSMGFLKHVSHPRTDVTLAAEYVERCGCCREAVAVRPLQGMLCAGDTMDVGCD